MNIIINFEPFNPTINDIVIKLAMVLFIPLFLALFVKVILMKFMIVGTNFIVYNIKLPTKVDTS
ncbi:hypothetical protein FHE73_13595 [Bacillus thuringiensis]|nr:hypothetical protein CGQ22_13480 [Bacillus sp. M13(2017)]QCY61754.1 hypothetical protein FHE73_13595 [Bacillus thuringiensis]